jgi:hypothetical protein
LGVWISNVLVPHLAVPVAGKHFFVIQIRGDVFSPGITSIDQVAFIAKQDGIKKVFLHNLFERLDLNSNNIISALVVIINAIGIDLKSNWHGIRWGTECLSAIHLIRLAQRGRV